MSQPTSATPSKRHLKTDGFGTGLQGEFGIGLLSFWTVGDTLTMTSTGADQRAYQMTMNKGETIDMQAGSARCSPWKCSSIA